MESRAIFFFPISTTLVWYVPTLGCEINVVSGRNVMVGRFGKKTKRSFRNNSGGKFFYTAKRYFFGALKKLMIKGHVAKNSSTNLNFASASLLILQM